MKLPSNQWPPHWSLAAAGKWGEAWEAAKSEESDSVIVGLKAGLKEWMDGVLMIVIMSGYFTANPPVRNPSSKDGLYSLEECEKAMHLASEGELRMEE